MTMLPTRKVAVGGLAGALTTIVISIAKDGFGYIMSPDLAAAVTTLISFAVSYAVPDPPETP